LELFRNIFSPHGIRPPTRDQFNLVWKFYFATPASQAVIERQKEGLAGQTSVVALAGVSWAASEATPMEVTLNDPPEIPIR
jgi:hypothetical protein